MDEREQTLKDLREGLDGLIMLNEWELALAVDLRRKMESLAAGGIQGQGGPPTPGSGKKTK